MKNNYLILSQYRLQQSRERIEVAQILLSNGKYADSLTRSYYAMFSAARALLATKGLDSAKHSGVISLFNLHFVKLGLLPEDFGKLLEKARKLRERSDYGDFVITSKEEAENQVKTAELFINEADKLLKKISKSSTEGVSETRAVYRVPKVRKRVVYAD